MEPAPRSITESDLEVSEVGPQPPQQPTRKRPPLLFDEQDYELVDLVNEFRTVGKHKKPEVLRRLFNPALHPRGIKELAATQERRVAWAVVRLLESLEEGSSQDRILALRKGTREVPEWASALPERSAQRAIQQLQHLRQLPRRQPGRDGPWIFRGAR